MSPTDPNRNGNRDSSILQEGAPASAVSQVPVAVQTPNGAGEKNEPETAPATKFATRADAKALEGMSKAKLALVGGGLLAAVLFFIFTAVVEKSPKHLDKAIHPTYTEPTKEPPCVCPQAVSVRSTDALREPRGIPGPRVTRTILPRLSFLGTHPRPSLESRHIRSSPFREAPPRDFVQKEQQQSKAGSGISDAASGKFDRVLKPRYNHTT